MLGKLHWSFTFCALRNVIGSSKITVSKGGKWGMRKLHWWNCDYNVLLLSIRLFTFSWNIKCLISHYFSHLCGLGFMSKPIISTVWYNNRPQHLKPWGLLYLHILTNWPCQTSYSFWQNKLRVTWTLSLCLLIVSTNNSYHQLEEQNTSFNLI